MLISEDYRNQNAQLHASVEKYGAGSWTRVPYIQSIITDMDYRSVLDYGCGKGSLAAFLNDEGCFVEGYDKPFTVAEYDPAIAGKDASPEAADLVVCTEVLEHVEPECLEGVLRHLAELSLREMTFSIATRPSSQYLPDGRNAHLIVEDADWWLKRLSPHFHVFETEITADGLYGRARPLKPLGEIQHKCAVGHDERQAQVKVNIERISERLTVPDLVMMPAHDRKAVLVCYGPSLADTWPTLALEAAEPDADVFTVSAAHRFVIQHGIVPKAQIDCDPREHKARQIGDPHPDVEYWLASCIHPTYLDLLEGHTVKLWHAYNGEPSIETLKWEPRQRMIIGGGSVGLRAMSLLYYLGYRKFLIHGMDGSFKGEATYAGEHLGKEKQVMTVWVNGRAFQTAPALILYSRYFRKQIEWMKGADIHLHGDGLLRHMFGIPENPMKPKEI